MKIRDIMTKNVAYVEPEASITEAAKLMQEYNVGSIPVCDNMNLIGIVTDRDIVVRNIAIGDNPMNTQVRNIMTSQVETVTPEVDVQEASTKMAVGKIRRMPVVATNRDFDIEASEALTEISKPAKPKRR